jgi:hypothetical protein
MSVILLKLAPYLIAGAALLGVGGWIGWSINPWQGRYTSLQAADAIERAHGEEAVRQALSAQLAQAQEVTHNNQAAMVTLANQNAQTAADRDATVARVHRLEQLLSATATRSAPSSRVPQAGGGSDPPASGTSGGLTDVERLLVNAKEECEHTANDYDALVTQIAPQVKP